MVDEQIVELEQTGEKPSAPVPDEHDPNASGRCRIYNSNKDRIGCKNTSSKDACVDWARWKGAYAYSWSPGYSC